MFGHLTYLGLELMWGLPVLLVQWIVGHDALVRHRQLLLIAAVLPSIYLSIADGIAIQSGVWTLHASRIIGIYLIDVPLEESIFFLLTNLMVVQTVILLDGPGNDVRKQLRGPRRQLRW